MSDCGDYFTVIFKGDLRHVDGNPLKTETPFGVPVAAGLGDAFARIDQLEGMGLEESLASLGFTPAPPEGEAGGGTNSKSVRSASGVLRSGGYP